MVGTAQNVVSKVARRYERRTAPRRASRCVTAAAGSASVGASEKGGAARPVVLPGFLFRPIARLSRIRFPCCVLFDVRLFGIVFGVTTRVLVRDLSVRIDIG